MVSRPSVGLLTETLHEESITRLLSSGIAHRTTTLSPVGVLGVRGERIRRHKLFSAFNLPLRCSTPSDVFFNIYEYIHLWHV